MSEKKEGKLGIRLHVYDTDMSVMIPREEEEFYRKAEKLITDTVNTYASYFNGSKTVKDLLYMALIDIALRLEKNEYHANVTPYTNLLSKLTSEIEEALQEREGDIKFNDETPNE